MMPSLYFPSDEFIGKQRPDLDLAADYLELSAVASPRREAFSADIVDALELAAECDYEEVDAEMQNRENVATGAVNRIVKRRRCLGPAYPFVVDNRGDVVSFATRRDELGHSAYLISLLLSNLNSVSPVLNGSRLHPTDEGVRKLRRYFQYFATAAMAAEVQGEAWSFGFPRPDGSGFVHKLNKIWSVLRDGRVCPDTSAPDSLKDDQVDVFASRTQQDGLPGFLLAAAQVATGKDWKSKSIKGHINDAFVKRWFQPQVPATTMVAYHVIPFARSDEAFRDDVASLGNVLHRLRIPRRVAESRRLVNEGVRIEAYDQLENAAEWVESHIEQASGR